MQVEDLATHLRITAMWTSGRYLRVKEFHKAARAPTIATAWTLRRPLNVMQVEELATHLRITAMWTSGKYLRVSHRNNSSKNHRHLDTEKISPCELD
jgi:hypothetical protein